jgi:hypothetical protein
MDNDNDDECDESESDSAFLHDNVRENIVKKAWDQTYESNDHLMFGSRMTNIDLSTLHPGQLQIFRLWQIYLENVDPLLKVTHSPTLQASIIDAASDMGNVSAALEALMFSIYCVSILSLAEDDCYSLFGSPRRDLLTNYQFGCRQALLKCEFLRSSDCDCLTALYLYLVSLLPSSIVFSNTSRSRSDRIQTPALFLQCLALLSASHSVWVSTKSPPMPIAPL